MGKCAGKSDRDESEATVECQVTDVGHSSRNSDRGDSDATRESGITDMGKCAG